MKINTITNDRSSNFTPAASKQMGIDEAAMALIIKSVTDMYSDPISAMMREVVSNAIDSHREAGTDVAVEVSLPDALNPVFTVQDRGIGMSREDMMNTYTTYGCSTKRDSNDAIGGFGYGSKSPLSAVSRFTVEAVKDGKMNTGTIFMDEQSRPSFDLIIDNVDTDEPNGVTVSIPISLIETSKVVRALAGFSATELKINGVNNPHSVLDHESTIMHKDDEVWTTSKLGMRYAHMFSVIIGGVIYPISSHDARSYFDKMGIEVPQNSNSSLIFRMPIGDVDMSPARENLIYSERTLKAIGDHYQAATEVVFNGIENFTNSVDTDNFTDTYEGLIAHRQIVDMFPSLIARTNDALAEKANGKAVPFYSNAYARNIPFNLGEYANNIHKINFVPIGMGNITIPMFKDIFMKDNANLTHYSRRGRTARASIETTTASSLRPALPLINLGGNRGVDLIVTDTPYDDNAFRNAYYAMRTDGQEAGDINIYFTTQPATALTDGAKHIAGKVISYTDFVQLTKDGMKAVRRAAAKKRESDPAAVAKKRTPIDDGFKANTLYASRQTADICTPDGVKFEASSLDKSHTYNISFVTEGNNPYSSSRRKGLAEVEVEAMQEVHNTGQVYLYTTNKSSAKALTARLSRDGYTVTENYGQAYIAANSFKEAIKGKVAKKFTDEMALAVIFNTVFNDNYNKFDNFDSFTNKATAKAVKDAIESAPIAPAGFDISAVALKSRYPMLGAFLSGGWSMERSARSANVDLYKMAVDYINMVDSAK